MKIHATFSLQNLYDKVVHVNRNYAVEYVTKKIAMEMNTENFAYDFEQSVLKKENVA